MLRIEIIPFWFITVVFVLLISFILKLKLRVLVAGIMILSIFQAATSMNIFLNNYPIGIQPAYFLLILFSMMYLLKSFLSNRHGIVSKSVIKISAPLIIFSVYSIVSAVILPRLFENKVFVFPPRSGLSLDSLTKLSPIGSNISQSLYLLIITVMFIVIVQLVIIEQKKFVFWMAKVYMITGLLIALIGFYQVIGWYAGWPFPDKLLFTNPVRPPLYTQTSHGIKRLSSTLLEPSQAAYFLLGCYAFSWIYVKYIGKTILSVLSLFTCFVALLLTTSTTAYIGLAFLFALFFLRAAYDKKMIVLSLYLGSITVLFMLLFQYDLVFLIYNAAHDVLKSQLFYKFASLSFANRIGVDLYSIRLVLSTFGLGVGLGSNRASSLVVNIISNTGIPGLICLVLWIICLRKLLLSCASCVNVSRADKNILRAYGYSVIAMLIASLISVPDLINLPLWINLALYTGFLLKIERECLNL